MYETLVIKHLQKYRSGLTVRECQELYGTTELRKIISDLKYAGYKFTYTWETGINRYGVNIRYKRYWLLSMPKKRRKK